MSSLKDRSAARRKGNGSKPAARQKRRGAEGKNHEPLRRLVADIEARRSHRRPVRERDERIAPLTKAQALYDTLIASKTLIFALGPAGTGKTFFGATRAAEALRDRLTERVIVTRPTIEVGQSLGFLPGELEEKNEPYFRPVREAFEKCLGAGPVEMYLKDGTIEARPLAYMRGASFENAWVILDEAQNTTPKEMEMFLTRIGEGCKVIVDGDLRQQDIAGQSGLADAIARLRDDEDVGVIEFGLDDIVRSGFCARVVKAYQRS